jgi:hypothetical protein
MRASSSRPGVRVGAHLLVILSGVAIAAGCFLPWYRIGAFTELGIGIAEGIIVLIIGLAVIGLAAASLVTRRGWLRPLFLIGALGALVLSVIDLIDIIRGAQAWQARLTDFVGWGILVVVLAALLGTAAGIASLRRPKR